MRLQQGDQLVAVGEAVKPRDVVERVPVERQQMGLRVVDHLHAMLDRPQQACRLRQGCRDPRPVDPAGARSAASASSVAGGAHGRIAAAVDHLLDLGEELDLADAAAPALQVEARAEPRALREMVADARGDLADFLDHPEIERAAPDERLDRLEEMLAERAVAGARRGRG